MIDEGVNFLFHPPVTEFKQFMSRDRRDLYNHPKGNAGIEEIVAKEE